MNIFCWKPPFSIEEADLRESFEAYGAVDSVKLLLINLLEEVKDSGFVEMTNDDEAQKRLMN
jgi:RNA recognition motif-containing protein